MYTPQCNCSLFLFLFVGGTGSWRKVAMPQVEALMLGIVLGTVRTPGLGWISWMFFKRISETIRILSKWHWRKNMYQNIMIILDITNLIWKKWISEQIIRIWKKKTKIIIIMFVYLKTVYSPKLWCCFRAINLDRLAIDIWVDGVGVSKSRLMARW